MIQTRAGLEPQMLTEPIMQLIDLKRLVGEINDSLRVPEFEVSLGEFKEMTPRRNPFLYTSEGKEISARGKFPLLMPRYGGLGGILGIDYDSRIGYVFVETGDIFESGDEARYETLRFRLKDPLELRRGRVIPNCSVKLLTESFEFESPPYKERRDHVRKAGVFWRRTDLSDVLPTEWFMKQR